MNEKPKIVSRFSSPLARDLFAIGADVGLMLRKQVESNIAAAKQDELRTEGHLDRKQKERDE